MADPVSTGAPAQGGAAGGTSQQGGAAGGAPAGGAPAGGAVQITPELAAWGKNKGIDNFEKLATESPDFYRLSTSYRETEKFLGGDKIPLPKDMNDAAAMRSVYQKLGMPEKSSDYKLTTKENTSPEFQSWAKETFHQAGVTQQQAAVLDTAWNGYVEGLLNADANTRAEKNAADKVGLEKDWGSNTSANVEVAQRARNMLSSDLGISRDALNEGLEEAFGLRDAMRILHFLGNKSNVTGDTFEGGDAAGNRGGGVSMTAEQATAEKQRLLSDREFANKYRGGDAVARQQLSELNAVIAAGTGGGNRVSIGNPGRR